MTHADVDIAQPVPRQHLHLGGNPPQFPEVCPVQCAIVRTDKIVPWLGHEHSGGGKLRWKIRNHHERDVKGSSNLGSMKGAGAAKRDHDEIARIVATFDRHLTHRQRHVHDRNLDDGAGSLGFRESERLRNRSPDCFARSPHVQRYLPTEKLCRIQAPQQKVGVGDCGLGSTLAIAGRTGIGPGAHRANLKLSRLVHSCDTAAAGTNFHGVHHREHHRLSEGVAADMVAVRHLRFAVACKIGFRGRASHVETNYIGVSKRDSGSCRGDEPTHGAGLEHRNGQTPGHRRRHHTAVRLHDPKTAGETLLLEHSLEPFQIGAYLGTDVRVQHSGRNTFVFAVLAKDLMRDATVGFRIQQLGHPRFVNGIVPRMQETHRHGFDAAGGHLPGDCFRLSAIQRNVNFAGSQQPFVDFEREMPRD